MRVLAFDPSGNHGREGSGTTGLCRMEDGVPEELWTISAKSFPNEVSYWFAHLVDIEEIFPDHIVIEGYKLYNHKGQDAAAQAHSDMQTSQLIGALKVKCYEMNIPYTIQYASDVKTRWKEDILVRKGYLEKRGNFHYFKELKTATHHRDALKHALHFWRYGRDKK